jgi:hypothetical protein
MTTEEEAAMLELWICLNASRRHVFAAIIEYTDKPAENHPLIKRIDKALEKAKGMAGAQTERAAAPRLRLH